MPLFIHRTSARTKALRLALAICFLVLGASTAGLAQVATPDAPDQSELLKDSKDRDFILHNFRTMYVDAHGAKYFGSDQMKAALGKNKDFWKLNIRIVNDRRVADVVLTVDYTFAWDYPFALTHQNTTIVLLSGKGEGPFSGPLGAADVARQFVNMAKPWREEKEKKSNH
jgi:disulfide oxidoreductase YuzD